MDLSTATLFGQIISLLFFGLIVYLIVLVPVSLRKIAAELAAIKEEIRKQNSRTNDS